MKTPVASGSSRRRRGRPSQEEGNAEDTRREILAHALRLFNARGFAAVSVDDIVAAAGVTKPTFYYHFPGKADAFVGAFDSIAESVSEFIRDIASDRNRSVFQRLQRIILDRRAMLNWEPILAFNEAMMDEAMAHLTSDQQRQICKTFDALHVPLRNLLSEGIASGELRAADPDILAVVFRQIFQPTTYHLLSSKNPQEVDLELLTLFQRGVVQDLDAEAPQASPSEEVVTNPEHSES
ncbi:MAG: TetR/AcrR family transcriptional regulator [Armatimonadaceae bacterium]